MKLIIVRHGQTDDNVGGDLAVKSSGVLLNEEGLGQVQKLGEHLKSEKIHVAYTSPTKRAVQTAEGILKHHKGIMVAVAHELAEQNLGVLEGLSKAEIKEIKKNSKDLWHLFEPEQGESYLKLQSRVKNFLETLLERHQGQTVLVVSHGGTLGVLTVDLLDKELTEENYRAHQPKNAEITMVEFSDGKKKIHFLNYHSHLA